MPRAAVNAAVANKDAASGPKTLTDVAYANLRDDIIHSHLKPGEKLRIEALRKRYEMGATPIREALSRLSSDGFVRSEGQRGFKVAGMTADDLEDVTNMRVLLENQALRQSITRGDDDWEANVVAAFHRLSKIETTDERDLADWEARNSDYHNSLIAACTSQWLRRFYEVLYDQHRRYRQAARALPSNRDLHQEHLAIYDAAMNRNVDAAIEANEYHIRATADVLTAMMREDEEKARQEQA